MSQMLNYIIFMPVIYEIQTIEKVINELIQTQSTIY